MIRFRPLGFFAVAALALTAGSATAQVRDWPSERPPQPLAARQVAFPPYEIKTLANGLRVVAVTHHEQPVVSLRLIIGAGGAHDPADKPGLANLVSLVLDQGTKSRSAQQIARTIDDIGGALGVGAGTDLTFINAVVMKDSFDLVLDLVSDVARNPAFAPEEIERQRQQVLSSLQVSYEDPDYLAGVVFDRLVYGFHPYGRPSSGTPDSVPAITRDDLAAFHARYFVPNNAILAVVGDVTPAEAVAGVEKAFGSWAPRELQMPVFDDPPPPTRRVIVVDRPGAVQTEIRVGQVAIPRRHPDYMALNMAMKVLGGEGANRLQRVLRSERGLTYGAQADLETLKQSGDFMAETDTRSESTGDALRVVVDEYWRLRRERVNRGELESAQDYLAGSFPLTIETPSAIALQVLNVLFYGLDLQDLETFPQRVRAVTPGDIQRVAEQFLKPDRLSIVLVGDADAFVPQLRGAGFDKFERIPAAALDLTAVDLRRKPAARPGGHGSSDLDQAQQPPSLLQGPGPDARDARAIIEKAIAALGGLETLRAVTSLRAQGTTTITGPQGPMEVETTTTIAYPDRVRVEGELPVGRVVQAYLGGQAWVQDPAGVRDAPAAMRDSMSADLARDSRRLLLEALAGQAQARALADAKSEDGRRLLAIEITPAGLGPVTLRLDPQTHLVDTVSYALLGPAGRPATMEHRLQDYRAIDGVKIPFIAMVRLDGAVVQERLLRKVEINPAIDPAVFAKPAR
jgi:zinc protease